MRMGWLMYVVLTGLACEAKPNGRHDGYAAFISHLNTVNADVLDPQLLRDAAEIQAYIDAFPTADYQVATVKGYGRFYIDDRDDIIKNTVRAGHRWEPGISRLIYLQAKPGTTVIDAGGHMGTHAVEMAARVGPGGRVYVFEPQRKLYRELVQNMRLNNLTSVVVPLRFALGRESGVIEMNPPVKGNEGGTQVGHGGDKAELRSIDSFGFRNVSLVKIDVEHFEDDVLEGASHTIRRDRPVIIIEIMGGHSYENASPDVRARIDGTIRRLETLAYEVTRLGGADYVAVPRSSAGN